MDAPETFQQQHSKFFKIATILLFYPPGIEQMVESKFLRKILWFLGVVPVFLGMPYILSYLYYALFTPSESLIIIVQIFRRFIIATYMVAQVASHMFRYGAVADLYHRWNYVINKDFCVAERKVILDKMTSQSSKLLFSVCIIRFLIAQLHSISFWFDRYTRSSEFAGVPHDNNSPYHFYYVAYQSIFFVWVGAPVVAMEFTYCFMMCMAEAEVKVLSQKLADILATVTVSDDTLLLRTADGIVEAEFGDREHEEAVRKVNHELCLWLKAHHEAITWIDDLKSFMHLNITIKYIYLAVHCSLVVIGMSGLGTNYNHILAITLTTVTNFSVCYYATVQADRLYDNSERLFLEAYGEGWYMYPVSTQKTLAVISAATQARPVEFFGLKNYQDNKENFSAVLQTAYNVLTFLLPMAET